MNVTLMHNPGAGDQTLKAKKLTGWLEDLGYRVNYQSTRKKKFLEALKDPGDLVVVAGGDGTVNRVARHLVGTGVPLAIVPVGTANNIASALGISGKPKKLVAGLESAKPLTFDVGLVRGPWGESRFFEGVGVGLLAEAICLAASKKEAGAKPDNQERQEFMRELRFLRRALLDFPPLRWRVTLDGEDASGEYLLCEVLNTSLIGPRLCLAPKAVPTDGLLDVILLDEAQRERLHQYLVDRLKGDAGPPKLEVRRAREVQISIEGVAVRIDDRIKRAGARVESEAASNGDPWATVIDVRLESGTLTVMVPA
jgi:diacylglycerol kinase (ATP)